MITFDFASIDFYENLFPFLHDHQIPVLVGVAWRYVAKQHIEMLPFSQRISPMETLAFQDEVFMRYGPFCSQKELQMMVASPYIQLASSGFAIRNLKQAPPYLATEVFLSRHCIELATGYRPIAFLYPFGKYDSTSMQLVRKEYAYSFVLGNTINSRYKHHEIYRLDMSKGAYHLPTLTQSGTYLKAWLKERLRILIANNKVRSPYKLCN